MKTLSITIENDLYNILRKTVPTGSISKFVSRALANQLNIQQDQLKTAYIAASKDNDRNVEIDEWKDMDVTNWK